MLVQNNSISLLSRLLVLIAAVGLSTGCGGQPTGATVSTVSASGVLTYKGAPLENHQVTLIAEGQRPAVGVSNAEGKFTLGTNTKDDGSPVGQFKVVVTYVGPPDHDPEKGAPPAPKVKIPAKYGDKSKTDLTVEVPSSGTSSLAVDLK